MADAAIGLLMPGRTLSRRESKDLTRRRLIDAAVRLVAAEGYGRLSASAVAREAGVAQPTFYVHFRDLDDLVRAIGTEILDVLREPLRATRARVIAGEGADALAVGYRLPIEVWTRRPDLLRIHLQEMHQPQSPIAEAMQKVRRELLDDLVADLGQLGIPTKTSKDRQRIEMIAEVILTQIETLALGIVEGRFENLDDAVDVLTRLFTDGVVGFVERPRQRRTTAPRAR